MMHETLQRMLVNQYEASMSTLAHCVERCPDSLWNAPVAKNPFSQVVFHTLFYADYYLEKSPESFRQQPFHNANQDLFATYEQLSDQEPKSTYSREQIKLYGDFCRDKALTTLGAATEQEFQADSGFPRRDFSRAELHLYNIRHIQHHAAQLILKLRLEAKLDVPWIGSGWQDPTA